MKNSFFEISMKIADEFLQSILFIDDQAYSKGKLEDNDFDPFEISKVFAMEQKICSVLNPTTEEDLKNIIQIAIKADVIVIDWRLDLQDSNNTLINEEDDDMDDHRGAYTIKIIQDVLSDLMFGKNGLKMIVIYTGETNLRQITETILQSIADKSPERINDFEIAGQNFKIVVNGKPPLARVRIPEIQNQVISYLDLPKFILNEFTKMTSGLVSNVALKAITSIRRNNSKILQLYNKQIDPAFLSHRAMLPVPEDAGELIKDSIISSFDAIIDYEQIEEYCSFKYIKAWMENQTFKERVIKINNKDLIMNSGRLKKWQEIGFYDLIKDIWSVQVPDQELKLDKMDSKYKSLHKEGDFFTPEGFSSENQNERFSILTHHKSNFANPSYIPRLSLGTLIKSASSDEFWLCIQQRCDSVRIPPGEERRFLFLSLTKIEGEKNFNFLVENGNEFIKLKIKFNSHNLRTIKFKPNKDGMVIARKYGKSKRYFFHSIYHGHASKQENEQSYIWIMDLKDFHAQRVANFYASYLSRVGLDESEWLRRWAST